MGARAGKRIFSVLLAALLTTSFGSATLPALAAGGDTADPLMAETGTGLIEYISDGAEDQPQLVITEDTSPVETLSVGETGEPEMVVWENESGYTVDFAYGSLTFSIEGGSSADLYEILDALGIELADVSAVTISDAGLFSASQVGDAWVISSHRAFQTVEWMRITMGGREYEITVTDAPLNNSFDQTFASGLDIATVTVDPAKLTAPNSWASLTGGSLTMSDGNVTYSGTLTYNKENNINGTITVNYRDAAILSDGTRAVLQLVYGNIRVYTNTQKSGTYSDTISFVRKMGSQSGKIYPCIWVQSTYYSSRDCRYGLKMDVAVNVVGADSSNTVIFTAHDINVSRLDNNNFKNLFGGPDQWNYSESVEYDKPAYGHNVTTDASSTTGFLQVGNRFVALSSSGGALSTVQSETASTVPTDGSKTATVYTSGAGPLELYLLPDGITHTITSSSGYYGQIELWQDGALDGSGWLWGGRKDAGATETVVTGTNPDKTTAKDPTRTYDVPDGKAVTYKMTPEEGYILDELNVSAGGNYTAVYADGHTETGATTYTKSPISYYTYTFPASAYTTDQTIHVTWKKAVQVKVIKTWDDSDNDFGLRPASLDIQLKKDGADYTGDGDNGKAAVTAADGWTYTYYNLDTTGSYTVTEDLGHAAAHYEETGNTSATKTDTKTVTLYADGSHYTHGGFDETTPAGNSYSSGTYTKETIEITITNKLKTGELKIVKDIDTATKADGSFSFTVTFNCDETTLDLTSLTGSATVWNPTVTTVGGTGSVTLTGIPAGISYSIAETAPPGWVLISQNGQTGTITKDAMAMATFTNELKVSLTISKTIAGNQGDKSRTFSYTLTLTSGGNPVTGATHTGGTGWTEGTGGSYSFKLGHNENITITDLPGGVSYTLQEVNDGYTVATAVTGDDTNTTAGDIASGTGNTVQDSSLTADTTIKITNTLAAAVPTGIADDLRPAMAAGVCGLILLSVLLLGRRRRRYE